MSSALLPSKPYHHGDLAQASLRVAADLLREKGLERFSLREVARRLDVSLTALYYHFPDKDALLSTIARHGMEEFQAILEQSVTQSEGESDDPVVRMGLAYVRFFTSKPYYMDLLFLPMHKNDEVIFGIWQGTFSRLEALLAAQGWGPEEIPFLGVWLWSGVHGLATMLREGILGRPDASIEDCSPVFQMTAEDLLAKVVPLVSTIVTKSVLRPLA